MAKTQYEHAFRATEYRVALARAWVALTIDTPCPPALRPWLERFAGAMPAWLITAHNPGATALAAATNRARHTALCEWAYTHARAWLPSIHRDPKREWPDEHGLLIAGCQPSVVVCHARYLGQLAIVAVRVGQPTELVWL